MASLEYSVYPGQGERHAREFHYSSAVRVGDRLELSGMGGCGVAGLTAGGWDPETGEIYREINKQIDQAFEVVQIALLNAGGKGWEQVSPPRRGWGTPGCPTPSSSSEWGR
jgi:enamine deaminase RidA (YjgF/YER057c/UK114 family)